MGLRLALSIMLVIFVSAVTLSETRGPLHQEGTATQTVTSTATHTLLQDASTVGQPTTTTRYVVVNSFATATVQLTFVVTNTATATATLTTISTTTTISSSTSTTTATLTPVFSPTTLSLNLIPSSASVSGGSQPIMAWGQLLVNGTVPVSGMTITVFQYTTFEGTAVTNSSGYYSLTFPSLTTPGTYPVVAVFSGAKVGMTVFGPSFAAMYLNLF